MSKTAVKLGLATLCASLLIQMLTGCAAFRDKPKAKPDAADVPAARGISYQIVAKSGPGAAKMYYYAYIFPSIRMSSKGTPIEKMTQKLGPNGGLEGWKTGSARSSAMSRQVERSFRKGGYNLISFPELLVRPQPYSCLVVSTFYTNPTPIKDPVAGGPNQTVTVKVKGALFGLDMDPAKSLPVGSVLCTGFYSTEKHNVQEVTGKLLDEAVRNLGDQIEAYGRL